MATLSNSEKQELLELACSSQLRHDMRLLKMNQQKLLQNLRRARKALKKSRKVVIVRTHVRDMVVTPEMVGLTIGVHNGKEFINITVTPEHIGHFLGEYAPTNKRVSHGNPGIGASRGSMYVPLK